VRYLTSLSGYFHAVGIYVLHQRVLELGPYLGSPPQALRIGVGQGICGQSILENRNLYVPRLREWGTDPVCRPESRSKLVVRIGDRKGKVLGQIDIESQSEDAFGERERASVEQVAHELGQWVSRHEFLKWKEMSKKK
jgi:putative methionine-R-sulfoxide reductase with GAF domain